jgi:hypothetical protein
MDRLSIATLMALAKPFDVNGRRRESNSRHYGYEPAPKAFERQGNAGPSKLASHAPQPAPSARTALQYSIRPKWRATQRQWTFI